MTSYFLVVLTAFLPVEINFQSATTSIESCDIATFRREQGVERKKLLERMRVIIAEVKLLSEKRKELIERKIEISSMNPVSRGLKGAFDLRYNRAEIDQRDNAIVNQIENLSHQARIISAEEDILNIDLKRYIFDCGQHAQN